MNLNLNKEWFRSEFINHEMMSGHRLMENELSFYEAIVNGDLEYVEQNLKEKNFANPEGMGKLSENPLQNLRYHYVVTVAMITRYCVHAGMEQEKAYSLSDFYILKMDKCNAIPEIVELHDTMCMAFCKQMDIIRKANVLSKPIVLCLDYIYTHLHYRITLEEVADHLAISKNYLSTLFKKEMGISLSEYIISLKIEKARNLLQYSDYTLSDISNYLAFSSESHFIQVFQKKVGVTPNKFRKQNFRSDWSQIQAKF